MVAEAGKIVGIVSRSDVLGVLHEGRYLRPFRTLFAVGGEGAGSAGELLSRFLPSSLLEWLRDAGARAEERGASLYLAGEWVRDLLRGEPGKVLELVLEGPPEVLGELSGASGDEGRLLLPGGWEVAVGLARTEFYEYPSVRVEQAAIRHDLYRRDFTINALAISLSPRSFGFLLDFFGGQQDLSRGLIRVLHNLSFAENPLRVLRALALVPRLGFRLERQTRALLAGAVAEGFLRSVPAHLLAAELASLLRGPQTAEVLARFSDFNLWPQLREALGKEREALLASLPQDVCRAVEKFL